MEAKVYNQKGKETGNVTLPESVFGARKNNSLVHQVVISMQSNMRSGTAHTKGRGDVRGGGKKPWQQKGTGRARHGSIRSPIWKGGGVTHGPQKEKVYEKKINKKMARRALWSGLSAKARDREILVIDDVKFPEAKTKAAAVMFRKFSGREEFSNIEKGNGVLVLLSGKDTAARRALRNLPYVGVEEARNLNMHTALQYRYILFPKSALETLK